MGEDITEYILRAIFHIEPVSDEIVEIKQQETVAAEISTDVVSSTDEIMTEDTGLETVDVVESAETTETTEIAEENTVVLE